MEELDAPPSVDELSKAIDSLACGKAPGKDGIPPEVIKVGKKTALLHHLHQLLQQCWEEGTVPQEMHPEKCREQRRPLYIALLDLTKAFDLVSRNGLFTLLQKIGMPPQAPEDDNIFHEDMQGTVQYDGFLLGPISNQERGETRVRTRSDTLWNLLSLLLSYAFSQSEDGVYIHTRSDGSLFKLARLRAKTKVRQVLIREMLFADDAALTAHSEEALQRLINCFAHACRVVEDFAYLGSTIASNLSLDAELNKRIGKAGTATARLAKRVWNNKKLTTNTKMKVYQACVLSTLLYGSESWTLYSRQERILGITWQDRVPNKNVLDQEGIPSMFVLLTQRRLRWLGHVRRMDDGRIPKDILFGELATGSRPTGRPLLRFKDVCKRDMRAGDIDPAGWESVAEDRSSWRSAVKACTIR
ncbi:uncharacterized protein LOC119571296, partial [Penaeus monodon]|uniref:uncharacterized protein LOC119571296 n=1 Tax=Penaeus monodon TaxID=6687 RepID=UPI0018A6FEB7